MEKLSEKRLEVKKKRGRLREEVRLLLSDIDTCKAVFLLLAQDRNAIFHMLQMHGIPEPISDLKRSNF